MTTTSSGSRGDWLMLGHEGVQVCAEERDGRIIITGVMVMNPDGVTAADLRSLSIPKIEANFNGTDTQGKLIRQHLKHYGSVAPDPPKAPTSAQLRLSIPASGRRYPDLFYVAVSTLYRKLVANGIRPAPALAEANDVPVTTVHRWIKEARSRGLLAPARKAGASG